jgi:hypothetical protein
MYNIQFPFEAALPYLITGFEKNCGKIAGGAKNESPDFNRGFQITFLAI